MRLHPSSSRRESARAARAFVRLVEIMRVLRSPDGCPWDRKQTLDTLKPFVIEEAYEVVDAIDRRDLDELCGELGDLVFEAVFLAQLCAEAGRFAIGDCLDAVNVKLVRRHPHIFEEDAATAPQLRSRPSGLDTERAVLEQWEVIKERERASAGKPLQGPLDGIPKVLPALLHAFEVGQRAATVGFDWPTPEAVLDKVHEEIAELQRAHHARNEGHVAEEFGDVLFALANYGRKLGVEPEAALRAANAKFTRRFAAMRQHLIGAGIDADTATPEQLETAWQAIKEEEGAR